ncbi:MAG TPA: FHA domain-containing protein [Alphaproteobacteria bacterium]|nr:FHA domain-containing protein [Alphaproteobacteria bacterium]
MSSWLRSLISRRRGGAEPAPVVELLVLEGVDAGEVFTVDGDEVMIGRRLPVGARGRGILLRDPTVSARQAIVQRRGASLTLRHLAGATNPTLIDGRPARGEPLRHGSRIRIGRVEIEVRERTGLAISHLTEVFSASARHRSRVAEPDGSDAGSTDAPTEELAVPALADDGETTAIRPVVSQLGRLVVERGLDVAPDQSFPIWSTRTLLGRAAEADVRIAELGVSRRHAELIQEGGALTLVHHSKVNPTLLNGREVEESEPVRDGDVIQLADSVVLRVELIGRDGRRAPESELDARRRSLKQQMERRLEIDRRIEEDFSVDGSFLDVDVVNSYGMKAETTRADHIVVSFERFRSFVGGVVDELDGHVLNSNGDELMCYFESTLQAVRAASRILDRLAAFNAGQNLLRTPFRFRLGIHTGRCLVDLDQGVAYSPVLDVAGHLQKLAEPDSLLVSQQTLDALPPELPFERAGVMEREGLVYYRLTGPVD